VRGSSRLAKHTDYRPLSSECDATQARRCSWCISDIDGSFRVAEAFGELSQFHGDGRPAKETVILFDWASEE